ncbi:MAG: hypothetical protein K2Y23_24010 [Cyanobacteria bacterium]|nr:hypothetical protein [Cyanobacteriota bacterium]
MSSSTSPHASFDPWLLAILFLGIIGAPLLWLIAEQTGYTLAYQACDARSTSWVIVPTVGVLAIVGLVTFVVFRGHRTASTGRLPLPLLGWLGVGMAVLMIVVMAASAIAPMMLSPCD